MDLTKLDRETLEERLVARVKSETQSTFVVLEYLLEVDRRAFYLEDGYAGLKDYCIRFLDYTAAEAGRRVHATLCLKRFPQALAMVRENRLSLSALNTV